MLDDQLSLSDRRDAHDVDEVELRGRNVEAGRAAGIVVDDLDKVVADVPLLGRRVRVRVARRHERRDVKDDLLDLIVPHVRPPPVGVGARRVEPAEGDPAGVARRDEAAERVEHVEVGARAVRVAQDRDFVVALARPDVEDADLVVVHDRHPIEPLERAQVPPALVRHEQQRRTGGAKVGQHGQFCSLSANARVERRRTDREEARTDVALVVDRLVRVLDRRHGPR